jgi:cysteinyl-tRNA synthetase
MTLRLYNTLTRSKEDFTPLDPNNVRMYVCGPTVWDYAHIGNARPVIVFDVLFRLLRQIYGDAHVTYVRNITDVDDKINARAREEGVSIRVVTERTTKQFHADIAALGVLPPTVEPRATEHISEMIAIIGRLIASGHAYAADGHVLFDVPSMKDYGQLSRRSLDEMVAGARVDVAPYKRGDMDFVLWKPSDADTPGWDSPWGRGRPGWHIECSAMSWKHLGEVFDIHGGGIDLVFPHHENEIAQSRCAFGRNVMANVWMHNGFLQVEGQKMSKSLGNFLTINELLETNRFGGRAWSGDVLRMAMLMTHYRQPLDFSVARLVEAEAKLRKFKEVGYHPYGTGDAFNRVMKAMSDDLNTPEVIFYLDQIYPDALDGKNWAQSEIFRTLELLGLREAMELAEGAADERERQLELESGEKIESLLLARLEARKAKNWAESDRIRGELASMGIAIKDNKDGTTSWEVKR